MAAATQPSSLGQEALTASFGTVISKGGHITEKVPGGNAHCQARLSLVSWVSETKTSHSFPGNLLPVLPLHLEVGMLKGLVSRDPLVRVVSHHCMQQGEALRGQVGCQ